jgi:iron complex outermembrane receptor protein
LFLNASYDTYRYDGTYAYDDGLFLDHSAGAWASGGLSLVRRFDRHALTVGAEYRHSFHQDQSASDPSGTLLDDRRHSSTAGMYVEDELRVSRRLLINAGLRWDEYVDSFGGTLNPRLGAIITPFDQAALKILYGRAFRAPNPFELYYEGDAVSAALGPERIATSELVWEQQLHPAMHVTVSAFRNRVRDLITQRSGSETSLDGLYFQNIDGATATGLEVEGDVRLPFRAHARVAQAFQSVHDVDTNRITASSPHAVSTAVADAPLPWFGLLAAFDGYRVGERRNVRGDLVDAATMCNLTISRIRNGPGAGVAVSVRNLFDAPYADPGSEEHRQRSIPQDGRTVELRVLWRF